MFFCCLLGDSALTNMFKNPFVQKSDDVENNNIPAKDAAKTNCNTNPIQIQRIHNTEFMNSLKKSPPSGASWSPAISRAYKGGNIPFEIPPSVPCRHSTKLQQIQPDVTMTRSKSVAQSTFHRTNNAFISDMTNNSNELSRRKAQSVLVNSSCNSPILQRNVLFSGSSDLFRNSVIGQIQPELYRYSEKEPDLHQSRCGRVWFSLVYDGAVETLTVKIIKVKQLQPRNNNSSRNCFVKVYILPDERISQQTKVKHGSNNPTFFETFVFHVAATDIRNRTLRISVYDSQKKSVKNLLGHALASLKEMELSNENDMIWRDLDDIAHPGETGSSLGELQVSLCYMPNLNRITVVIMNAKNLKGVDLESTGIQVKVQLTQGHRIIKTKKTTAQVGVCNPSFSESFTFNVSTHDIDQTCMTITVLTTNGMGAVHKMALSIKSTVTGGRSGTEHKYGNLSLGSFMYCRGAQLLHWQEMLGQPCKTIAKWHSISEPTNSE